MKAKKKKTTVPRQSRIGLKTLCHYGESDNEDSIPVSAAWIERQEVLQIEKDLLHRDITAALANYDTAESDYLYYLLTRACAYL